MYRAADMLSPPALHVCIPVLMNPSPYTVITWASSAVTWLGDSRCTDGGKQNVKPARPVYSPRVSSETRTSTSPASAAGAVQCSSVDDKPCTCRAASAPKWQAAPSKAKPEPITVTTVPPCELPAIGCTALTTASCKYSKPS